MNWRAVGCGDSLFVVTAGVVTGVGTLTNSPCISAIVWLRHLIRARRCVIPLRDGCDVLDVIGSRLRGVS